MTLMKVVSATWALIALVLIVSPASAESLVEWELDGEKLDDETGFNIQPGKVHELRVKLVEPGSSAEITLARTLPTDRTHPCRFTVSTTGAAISTTCAG